MIFITTDYKVDGQDAHMRNFLSFHPNYYSSMYKRHQDIVLFFHSDTLADKFIGSLRDCYETFGTELPKYPGLMCLVQMLQNGLAVRAVTVAPGRPLHEAMLDLAKDSTYEHAQLLRECVESIFTSRSTEHD